MTNKRFENRNKRFKPIKNYGKAVNEVFIKDTINEWYIHTEDGVVDLLNSLSEENEQLRQSVEYWQKKYEEGTETFQINENDTTFQFNFNQAQLYTIKNVSPNGVVRLGNGHKAKWRMKDVREISQELPPFEDFNRETFMQMRNKFRKFDKDVLGRIIYNIYIGTFGEYI